jgi:hypothetical protein
VEGDSPLSESDVQSSSISLGLKPRWWDRRWCLTMVVLRQKLTQKSVSRTWRTALWRLDIPLQAAVVGAFIWPLSCVDAPVPGKTGGIREALAAANMLALMRFLTSVRSDVDCERTSLDEALSASRRHTGVGPLVRMYPVVSLQVRLSVEALLVPELASSPCRPSPSRLSSSTTGRVRRN